MAEVIAIAGKGGTGKTTLAALLTLWLARSRADGVLAIDADPNSTLGDALGVADIVSVSDVIEQVAASPETVPASMGKDAYIAYRIHQNIKEAGGFDLLAMGRPEGPGCYCYANNVLRRVMGELTSDYAFSIVDNEAGLEHFSRKTTRSCQKLFVVSDESAVGLKSARRMFELVDALGIPARERFLVVNRSQGNLDPDVLREQFNVGGVFRVPQDEALSAAAREGRGVFALPAGSGARRSVEEIGERLWPKH
ncbi:MAG: AAA family ATPase [Deltaproteobacteria bacterium]